ncbi:MAG: tetratricopeptide repeat protein [Planctomycetota bacterium]
MTVAPASARAPDPVTSPSPLGMVYRALLWVAWACYLLLLTSNAWLRLLDTPALNDNNLALMEQGVWGLSGPLAALFQPASHYLVRFLPGPDWTTLALAMPWILGAIAAAVCLGFTARHARRPGAWPALWAWLFAMLALLATPHALVLALLVPLVASLAGGHRWRLTVAIAIPACLLLFELASCALVPAERTWRQAGNEPLARVFLAEQLATDAHHQRRQEARALLEDAVPKLEPSLLKLMAMEQLLQLHFAAGDKEGASKVAEAACAVADLLAPGARDRRVHHYLLAARCLFQENYDQRALLWVAKVKALVPHHPEVLAYEAEHLLRDTIDPKTETVAADHENNARADALIARALAGNPRSFRAHLAKGRWAQARGSLLEATKSYRNAIDIEPTDPEPHLLLANLYLQHDMVTAAEQAVLVAMGKSHRIGDPRLEYCLGLIYFMQGRQNSARKRLEQVLLLQPGNIDVRRILSKVLAAQALARVGQVPPATLADIAARIRELDPENPQGLVVMAVVKSGEKRFRDAIVLLEEARKQLPADGDVLRRLVGAHRNLGYQLLFEKKTELAMDQFHRFLDLAPSGTPTSAVRDVVDSHCKKLERQGWDEMVAGNLSAAEAAYERSVRLLPDRPEGYHCLAAAKLAQKEFDVALRAAQRAERLARKQQHTYGIYRMLQVDILQHMGKGSEARELALEFLKDPGREAAEVIAAIRKMIRD